MSNFNIDTGSSDSIHRPSPADPASGVHGIAEEDVELATDIEASQAGVIDLANRVLAKAWAASTVTKRLQLIRGTNGTLAQCTAAGTTGASQPTWPTTVGATVTDGTVTWTVLVPIGAYVGWGGVVDRLHVFGHSYAEGYGTSGYPYAPFSRTSSLLARRLGAQESNHAVSGSEAYLAQRNLCGRVNNRVQPSNPPATVGPVKLALVWIGANDAGNSVNYTDTAAFPAYVTNAVRRLRASQVWEAESDAAWAFTQGTGGSNWTTSTSGNYKSGATSTAAGGTKVLNAAGNVFTLTLPSSFQGGKVTLVGLHQGSGADFSITLDGVAEADWNSLGNVLAQPFPDSYSLTLTAGTHTIVGTCTTFNAGSQIDYAMVEASSAPGILLLPVMAAPTQPSGPGTHTPITAADIATFNGYLQTVAASFSDGMVQYVPITLDVTNAAYWIATGDHPSDLGHEVIEAQVWAFLLQTGWLTKLPRAKAVSLDTIPRLHVAGHLDDSAADRVTLAAGTATLSSRAITANTRAVLTRVGTNANAGQLNYAVVTPTTTSAPGTMTIASSNVADTSVVDVLLYEAVNAS